MNLFLVGILLVTHTSVACPMRAQYENMYGNGYYSSDPVPQAGGVPGRLVAIQPRRQRVPRNVHMQRRPRYDNQASESRALLRQVRSEQRSYARSEFRNQDEPVHRPVPVPKKTRDTLIGKETNFLEKSKDMVHQGLNRPPSHRKQDNQQMHIAGKERKDDQGEKFRLQAAYDEQFRQREAQIQMKERMIQEQMARVSPPANVIPRFPVTSGPAGTVFQYIKPGQHSGPQIQPQHIEPATTQYVVIPQRQIVPEKQTTRTVVVEEYLLPGPSVTEFVTNPNTISSAYPITTSV